MQQFRFLFILALLFFLSAHGFTQTADTVEDSVPAKKIFPVSSFLAVSCDPMLMEAHEYVYRGGEIVVSDLRWPLAPAVSYTVHGGIYFPKGIHIEGNVSFLQPMKTGSMVDKDFEDFTVQAPLTGLTKRSEHVCNILSGLRWMVKAGVQIAMPQTALMKQAGISILVEPMISCYSSAIRWHSYNGYLQYAQMKRDGSYAPWTETLPKVPITQDAVSYHQQMLLPAIGIGWEVSFPHNIVLNTDVHINPHIMALTEDIHHARNMRFVDVLEGGWALYGRTRLTWTWYPFCAVFCSLFYQYAKTAEGFSVIFEGITKKEPSKYTPLNTAGTALYGASLAVGFAVMLGR